MLKEIVRRSEPSGLHGAIYYDPNDPTKAWRVYGAVGVDALYEAMSSNPGGRFSPAEISAGFQVVDDTVRVMDTLIDEGGWILPDREPQSLPTDVDLLAEVRNGRVVVTTPKIFRLDYGLDLGLSDPESEDPLVLVTPGLSAHLRYSLTGHSFQRGLNLLCAQQQQGRNIELPRQLVNGLVAVTDRLVQAQPDLEKLPFPSVQAVKQRFVNRSTPLGR